MNIRNEIKEAADEALNGLFLDRDRAIDFIIKNVRGANRKMAEEEVKNNERVS